MAAQRSTATPRILGLTGPIASGKTTVGSLLLKLGATERIDADQVVHELMAAETETTELVADAFGGGVLDERGAVDRVALGAQVFADPAKLRVLESITHPAVRRSIRAQIDQRGAPGSVIVIDAVKLLQGEMADWCESIWVVTCAPEEQLRRLVEDRGMNLTDALQRLDAQPSFEDARVTAVIDNSRSLENTRSEVARYWSEFIVGSGPKKPAQSCQGQCT